MLQDLIDNAHMTITAYWQFCQYAVICTEEMCVSWELYRGVFLTTERKAWKNLSQGSRRVPAGTMKTEYTEQGVHNNKNT